MRNQEAARYARWSAIAAGLIVLLVAGVYIQRAILEARARRAAPPMVPATVQQRSADFSYSDVEQGRTIFTIRASQATRYKDRDRALLEDVWITIYGQEGNRDDDIHTRECSYEPLTGAIRCQGDVQIDLRRANPVSHKPADEALQVKTRDLLFNRETGQASTSQPVEFRFPAGQGRGVGIGYSTHDSILRVEHKVEFDLAASKRTGNLPVSATGSSLEIHRGDRVIVLNGPAVVRQGFREISAEKISIELDGNYHAQRAIAGGDPIIQGMEDGGKFSVTAKRFEASLSPEGWIASILADGNIKGVRQTAGGTSRFSATHVNFAMFPGENAVREMMAEGDVTAELQQGADSRVLKTNALLVTFSPSHAHSGEANSQEARHSSFPSAEAQRIDTAETLAPATVVSKAGNETTSLRARRLVAKAGSNGRLEKLLAHSGVEVRREIANRPAETSTASELTATFAANGAWDILDESGNVRFLQDGRQASAAHARFDRSTGTITLDGSPVLSDSTSRTTAGSVTINQESGELRATGGVVSTYLSDPENNEGSLASGGAHLSAESLSGSSTSGHVVYAGNARLWQGETVLESDKIELWRDSQKMIASGHVIAVFPQTAGPLVAGTAGKSSAAPPEQTLWRVRAPVLTYWGDQGKARLEGGVIASSEQGTLESRTLELFWKQAGASGSPAHSDGPRSSSEPSAEGKHVPAGQQLNRVLAEGSVVVRQGERRATAEQAEYTASDGKFVLSGGQPTLTDAASDTTTGRSLTFFVANDTILVDSQQGSRTLTKHRVEK